MQRATTHMRSICAFPVARPRLSDIRIRPLSEYFDGTVPVPIGRGERVDVRPEATCERRTPGGHNQQIVFDLTGLDSILGQHGRTRFVLDVVGRLRQAPPGDVLAGAPPRPVV